MEESKSFNKENIIVLKPHELEEFEEGGYVITELQIVSGVSCIVVINEKINLKVTKLER